MNSFVKDGENTDTHEEESEGNHDLAEDLEAWKEVHEHLLVAVQKAQQSIAAQKAQRRYWLEEIAWNLNDNGSLTNASRWRRVAPLVKTASSTPGYKATAPTKMKKMSTSGAAKAVKKPRKKKEKEGKGSDASKESGRQEISPPRETVRLSTDFTDTSERSVPMSESSYFPTPRGHPKGHDPQDHSLHSSWAPVYSSASLPPDEAHARDSEDFSSPTGMVAPDGYAPYPSPPQQPMPFGWTSQGQLPPSASQHYNSDAGSPPLSSTVPRNYTSLQDVAAHEDDDSDQDRF